MQINRSHPLAPSLRFFIVFINGVAIDLVSWAIGARNGSAAIQGGGVPVGGGTVAKLAAGTSDYYEFAHRPEWDLLGELTLAWRGRLNTGGVFHNFAGKHLTTGATNNPFDFRSTNDNPPRIALVRAAASGSLSNHFSNSDPFTLGASSTAEVTQGATLDLAPTFYANGRQAALFTNSSGPASPATSSSAVLRVGRRPDGVEQMDGFTEYVAGWATLLDADELREFRMAPYALLAPRETPVGVHVGGGPTFQAAWAARANTVIQGALHA